MATKPQVAPSKPRHLLTAAGAKDLESTLIPKFYSKARSVPPAPRRPFSSIGAPGRFKHRSPPPPRPATTHSEIFNSAVFPNEFDRSQILDRSSPHLYPGRYVKPKQWILSGSGKIATDDRKSWQTTNKFPTPINTHSVAASSSWTLLRPTVSKSLVQMGVYYTSRL
jgi:hypothetical protein